MILLQLEFPLRTVTGMNVREHFRARARRVKAEHLITRAHLSVAAQRGALALPRLIPLTVTLTRISNRARWLPRKKCWQACDDDAVPPALKGVRDALAAWLGLDDGSELLTFRYAQDRGPALAVRVRIEVPE